MTLFFASAGGVLIGYLWRSIECKRLRDRRIVVEPYPQRIHEPTSNVVWLDDDTEGLTVD